MTQKIDVVKDAILQYMNELSLMTGGNTQAIVTIAHEVNKRTNIPENEVKRAILFLHEEGYLTKIHRSDVDFYRISSKGAQNFSPSKYSQSFSHITVNQSGGISIVGSGNSIGTINQTTISTINELDKVTKLFNESNLNEEKKKDVILDIESVKNQLAKSEPDKSFIKSSWEKIIATAGFANNTVELMKALTLLAPLLQHFVPGLPPIPAHGELIA